MKTDKILPDYKHAGERPASRGKKLGIISGIVAGMLYLTSTLPFSVYQLHKTEYGVEKRFGDIVYVEKNAGPHLIDRWWVPTFGLLSKVKRLDNRLLEYTDSAENIPTKDRKFIHMSRYCKWRISDPELFENAVGSEESAQSILDDVVFSRVWEKVGAHTFEENQTSMREDIREKIIKTANEMVNQYGMEIPDIRIVKLNLPAEVRPKIHERMREEQLKLAAEVKAEGTRRAEEIRGGQEREVETLLAEGRNEAKQILGKAQKKVAETFKKAYEDPEFFNFYKTMETYKEIVKKNKEKGNKLRIILSNDNKLLELLLNGGELPEDLEKILQNTEKE